MNIKKLDKDNLHEYNKLVDISNEGTIFHKTWWLDIFKNYYGKSYDVDLYGVFENDNLIAGMPIPINNKFGFKFIYLPKLTPYLGSFYMTKSIEKKNREISWKKEINKYFAEVFKEKGICLYYSFGHDHIDLQPFKWLDFDIGVNYTYVLKLDEIDKTWENLNKDRKYEINKSYKENYSLKFGGIDSYIELSKQTMKRQNHAVLNEKLLMDIYGECKKYNSGEVFTVYNNNEATAALFLVWDTKRSYYLGAGINDKPQGMMSLLLWEAIKYTKEKLNLNEFDFEGSDVKSIEFYFRKFGGNIKPIFFISENSAKKFMIMKLYNMFK